MPFSSYHSGERRERSVCGLCKRVFVCVCMRACLSLCVLTTISFPVNKILYRELLYLQSVSVVCDGNELVD